MRDAQERTETSEFLHTPTTGTQQNIILHCIMPSFTAGDAVGPVSMQHQVYIQCSFFSYSSQLGEGRVLEMLPWFDIWETWMREVNQRENLLKGTDEWHRTTVLNDFSPKEIIPLLKYTPLTRRNIKPQGIRIIKKKKGQTIYFKAKFP